MSNSRPETMGWSLDKFIVEKFWVDQETGERDPEPYEVIESEGNLLMYGGASALFDLLIGAGNVSAFNEANTHIGVGDSTTASDRTQTDLLAPTNKFYQPMDTGYPLHTDGTSSGNASIIYKATFATGDANFDWNEWGLFNALSGGRMLNRKVEVLGTKTVAAEWTLTIVASLS